MNKNQSYDIAILGATGAVGEEMLSILEERQFPVRHLYLLASAKSVDKSYSYQGKSYTVLDASTFDFKRAQIALFSAGAKVSKHYAPLAVQAGCVVIDNTSAFRYESDVPLVVPEVNPQRIGDYRSRLIIANPNCSTIQLVVALKPIYDVAGIIRVNIATYQAVSGSGQQAIQVLAKQSAQILNGEGVELAEVYPKPIAFNVIPHIDVMQSNGYTREEMKMVWETQKIMEDARIRVNPTAVRVPTFTGHAEAVHLETERKIELSDAKNALKEARGIILMEDDDYPTPATSASGQDAVYVGRVREDISHPCGLNFWVVSDNLRKGAALNAIQIAEILTESYWS